MQVVHILAGTKGYCDDIETTEVQRFITDLTEHFTSSQSDLLQEIVTRGTLKKEELSDRVIAAIESFRSTWS